MSRRTEFKIVPSADEISQIERVAEFVPTDTAAPRVLSGEQVQTFNRVGFLTGIPIFNRNRQFLYSGQVTYKNE